jgi:hypothetical protein
MLLTLPKENAMNMISLCILDIYKSDKFWKEALARLDRITARGYLQNLTCFDINVPFSSRGSGVELMEQSMPLTKEKGILHITLED